MYELNEIDQEMVADPMVCRFEVAANGSMHMYRLDQACAILAAMYDSGERMSGPNVPSNGPIISARAEALNQTIVEREMTPYSCEYVHAGGKTIERVITLDGFEHRIKLDDKFDSFDQAAQRARQLNILWARDQADWQLAADLNIVKVEAVNVDPYPAFLLYEQSGNVGKLAVADCSLEMLKRRALEINWRISIIRLQKMKEITERKFMMDHYGDYGSW